MPQVCFKPITWYIEMHCRGHFSCVVSWLFILSDFHSQHVYLQEESLSWFLCAVELSACQLMINYDQDKVGVFFLHANCLVSFPLEDKNVVNEYHVVWESHDSTQKKFLHVVHLNVPCDWFELNLWHQKHYSEDGKKIVGGAVYWEE